MVITLLKNNKGFSLIEVIASVLIITIILLSFFSLLIQTKKTEVRSNETVVATYIAQAVMEEIYYLSTTMDYDEINETIKNLKEHPLKEDPETYFKDDAHKNTLITTSLAQGYQLTTEFGNGKASVTVHYDGREKAKFENYFIWGNRNAK